MQFETTEITALTIVGIMIILDWVTGLLKAVHAHDISSKKMREGLWHKSGFVLVMLLAEVIEHAQAHFDMGFTVPLIVPMAIWIVTTEMASILENISAINPEIAESPIMQLFHSNDSKGDEE